MKKLIYVVLILAIGALAYYGTKEPSGRLEKSEDEQNAASLFAGKLAENYNTDGLTLKVQ